MTMPPNIIFSVGYFGEFTGDELIKQVEEETEVGKATIDMQINFIKEMPKLLKRIIK